MNDLPTLQRQLRDLLPEGIEVTVQALKAVLADRTDAYRDLLLLEARYKDVNRRLLMGTIAQDAAQLAFNQIREALMDFIDGMQPAFLSDRAAATDARPDQYNGEVMYRIPDRMTCGVAVRCLVRLAFDRTVLLEGLDPQPEDVLKDIRISEVMGVELLDGGKSAFSIRTINDAVQFVEKDLPTEWLFFVTPLTEGIHPLLLKISVIEIRDGVERKRNVVLEEQVEILTVPVPQPEPAPLKTGYALAFGRSTGRQASGHPPPAAEAQPEPAVPPPVAEANAAVAPLRRRKGLLRRLVPGASVLVLLLGSYWVFRLNSADRESGGDIVFREELPDKSKPTNSDAGSYGQGVSGSLSEVSYLDSVDREERLASQRALTAQALEAPPPSGRRPASLEQAEPLRLVPAGRQDAAGVPTGPLTVPEIERALRDQAGHPAVEAYFRANPDADFASMAKVQFDSLEAVAWNVARTARDTGAVRQYLRTFPEGRHSQDARRRLRRLQRQPVRTEAGNR